MIANIAEDSPRSKTPAVDIIAWIFSVNIVRGGV